MYTTKITVTIGGDERDAYVRAYVECGWDVGHPNGFGARLDGDAEVRVGNAWVTADDVELGEGDLARIEEALCDAALNDDSDQCVDEDDFARDYA